MPARRMPAQEQQRIVPDICISVKKDDSTLEYELTQMTQGYQNLEDFTFGLITTFLLSWIV